MQNKMLSDDVRKDLKKTFDESLGGDVNVMVFTRKGPNQKYNEVATGLLEEFAEVDPRIKVQKQEIGGEASARYNVDRSPTILVEPERMKIRFTGAPLGEEGRSFVMALIMASKGDSMMPPEAVQALAGLKDQRDVQVFVSPT